MTSLSAQAPNSLAHARDLGLDSLLRGQRATIRWNQGQRLPTELSFQAANTSQFFAVAPTEHVGTRPLAAGFAPVRAALRLQAFWKLSDEDMLTICGLAAPDFGDPAGSLETTLASVISAPFVKSRLKSLMVIRTRLSALLGGDGEAEKRWLNSPWPRLNGRTPLETMKSGDFAGLTRVEAELREFSGT